MRPITLAQAQERYPHRYTGDHKPAWANKPAPNGKRYAPQYRSDREWFDNTRFPEEMNKDARKLLKGACQSSNPSWPSGQWLP